MSKEVVEILAQCIRRFFNLHPEGRVAKDFIEHLTAAGLEIGPGWSGDMDKAPFEKLVLLSTPDGKQMKSYTFHEDVNGRKNATGHMVRNGFTHWRLPTPPLKDKETGT